MSTTEDDQTKAFARALFTTAQTDDPDEPDDDKGTVTPEPTDDQLTARLIFNSKD